MHRTGNAPKRRGQHSSHAVHLRAELRARLDELASLEPNWDGYGAPPPTPYAVSEARDTLDGVADRFARSMDDLFLAPSVDGGVRLEWTTTAGRELTIIIPPERGSVVEFYRADEQHGIEGDICEKDLTRLSEMLTWLAG